jgi:hypothetical protein
MNEFMQWFLIIMFFIISYLQQDQLELIRKCLTHILNEISNILSPKEDT